MFGINRGFPNPADVPPGIMAAADQMYAELKEIADTWIAHRAVKGFEGKWDDDSAVCMDLAENIMDSVEAMGPRITTVVVGYLVNRCAREKAVKTNAMETASDPTP